MDSTPFAAVHEALTELMTQHASSLSLTTDGKGNLTVESDERDSKGKARWFGAVQTKKSYVSYHLMPVYENPGLLDDISPELRARMQGKSCFNFKNIDTDLFAELGRLTAVGVEEFTNGK